MNIERARVRGVTPAHVCEWVKMSSSIPRVLQKYSRHVQPFVLLDIFALQQLRGQDKFGPGDEAIMMIKHPSLVGSQLTPQPSNSL